MMFNPGETIEIASPGSLFNSAEGVTLSFTAESDMEDVATVAVSGSGMVTVTAQDMAGVMAHITITAHASLAASGAMGVPIRPIRARPASSSRLKWASRR